LVYNEERRKWIGVHDGKLITLEWPTFKDIIAEYMVAIGK